MIKADNLREFRPTVRYQDGADITLKSVQYAIEERANEMGISVAFYDDQVKSGGILSSSLEDCVVLYNPEHENEYFKFCIRVRHQGTYAFVSINDFGQSKQLNKAARAEFGAEDRKGKGLSYKISSKVTEAILNAGKNIQKKEEEENYYQCIFDIFDMLIS